MRQVRGAGEAVWSEAPQDTVVRAALRHRWTLTSTIMASTLPDGAAGGGREEEEERREEGA